VKVLVTNTAALNTGDAAILLATLDILREAFGTHLEVTIYDQQAAVAARYYPELAFRPVLFDQLVRWTGTRRVKGGALLLLAAASLWRLSLRSVGARFLPPSLQASLAEFSAADLIVSAGGTYFVPYYRIFPKVLDLLVAIALGRPFVLFTQSLGPFPQRRQRLLRFVLRRARIILTRDARSRRHLLSFGISPGRIAECADAAFALATPPATRDVTPTPSHKPLRVAVSVRNWPHLRNRAASGMGRYLSAVATMIGWLIERHGAQVTFLSTCQGVSEYWTDDSRIADATVARLPARLRQHVRVDRSFHTPRELLALLGRFDLVVATRLHVAILALCAGTPVLPIAYEFKTTELFTRLGLGELVQDIESVTSEDLCSAVEWLLAARADIRAVLPRWVARERRSALTAGDYVRSALEASS
jgi:colanic acid/amylovoran biosynthesis protein